MKNKFHPLLAVIFFVVTIPIRAQVATNTGSIYGKVFDEKDAPISGVNILLESDAVPGKCASPSPGGAFRLQTYHRELLSDVLIAGFTNSWRA